MVGASFTVAAVAQVLRSKKGITAVGNAQVSTAQSKFGGSSSLYDGNGDYLQLANSSDYNFTGNYTIEGWWYQPSNVAAGIYPTLIGTGAVSDNKGWAVTSEPTTNKINFITSGDGSSGMQVLLSSASLSAATWNHWAVVRSSSVLTVYINGTASGSTYTTTGNSIASTYPLYIGGGVGGLSSGNFSSNSATVVNLNGYLDEIRVSNSARYTTTFTPSTTPFVNDANTVLLIHANGTNGSTFFEDDNGVRAQKSVVNAGGVVAMLGGSGSFTNATVSTTQSKFGGTSLSLNGTNQFVMIPSTFNNDFSFTDAFTLEAWIYPTATSSFRAIMTNWESGFFWAVINGNELAFYANGSLIVSATGLTVSANNWYHVAVSRSGTSLRLWLNGSQVGSTGTLSGTINADDFTGIGCNVNNYPAGNIGAFFQGFIDEVRVSNSARYTSNFTAPTQPFVNDANTVLLIHADGTDASTVFRDDNGSRNQVGLFSTGGALISTTQSKFGGSSMFFDGTNDLVRSGVYSSLALNTGNWTIEGWIYTSDDLCELINYQDFPTNNGWAFGLRSSGRLLFVSGDGGSSLNVILSSNNAYTNNTWTHFAVVYNSGTITLYSNGTNVGSSSWVSPDFASVDGLRIGAGYGNASGLFQDGLYYYAGYLDEVRISNTARYTANFTVATQPFQNDANTVLLLHGDGTNNSTVFVDDNGIAPYTP
jgi:hypothetical protein